MRAGKLPKFQNFLTFLHPPRSEMISLNMNITLQKIFIRGIEMKRRRASDPANDILQLIFKEPSKNI